MVRHRGYPAAAIAVLCVWWSCCFQAAICYNVDTTYPVVYAGRAGSQFGYSVSFHADGERMMILIGAPKDTYSNVSHRARGVEQTGVVFVCTARPGSREPCIELGVDVTGNQLFPNGSLHSEKSQMRLGSSVGSFGPGQNVAVCAEKYSTIWYKEMVAGGPPLNFYDPVGRCMILRPDIDRQTSVVSVFQPCDDPDHRGWHRLGYCLTGNSMDMETYPNGKAKMAVSSPGAFYKRGMVWLADAQNTAQSARQVGLSQNPSFGDAQNGYGGYAVAQGDFDGNGKFEVAMSRPRARTDFTGQVWITESDGQAQANVVSFIYLLLEGTQVGEYFGHSLAAIDTNNDGKPELFIGSPTYIPKSGKASMLYDYGRISVFSTSIEEALSAQHASNNFTTRVFTTPDMEIVGQHPGGHFGTAIASAGDLDNNGYNDVVVGSPYEMEEGKRRGAIYIYSGSATGMESVPMQRISPLDLNQMNMVSFGSVLAKGWDIDGNSYSDILVSAVDSDQVIMLRSRPVVDIDVSMHVMENIDMVRPSCLHATGRHITCFKVSVCGKFNGSSVYSVVGIDYELEVDKQLKFNSNDKGHIFDTLQLDISRPQGCKEHVVEVTSESFNPCKPALVRLVQYSLQDRSSDSVELSPVLNRRRLGASKSIDKQVLLIRNCPNCNPDIGVVKAQLAVRSDLRPQQVVHGQTKQLALSFSISSHGTATACSSMAKISLPHGVTFQQHLPSAGSATVCVPSNNDATEAQCNLPALMGQGMMDNVVVLLGVGGLGVDQTSITVRVSAQSYNPENGTLDDNEATASIGVIAFASLKASAQSRPRRLRMVGGNSKPTTTTDIGPLILHEFQIFNQGPSGSPPATVNINFPMKTVDNRNVLYLTKVEANSREVVCNHTGLVNPLGLANIELGSRSNSSSLHRVRGFFSTERTRVPSLSANQVSKACLGYFCWVSVLCTIPGLEANASSTVSFSWRVWMDTLRENAQVPVPTNLTTNVVILQVAMQRSFTLSPSTTFVGSATTQLVGDSQKQFSASPWWVWLIGFLAGFLLIALMVILLRKCHFFQRKTLAQRVEENHQASK